MLKVYGQSSSRTFRVIWLCREGGLQFTREAVTIRVPNAESRSDWYLRLNPNGRIPTIDDDGFVLWESSAIVFYLAQRFEIDLWPKTPQSVAKALQWSFFAAHDLEPNIGLILHNRYVKALADRDAGLADGAERELNPKLKVLEDHLRTYRFFGDGRWDLADFMVACSMSITSRMRYDLSRFPTLSAWLDESLLRPAAVAALDEWEDLLKVASNTGSTAVKEMDR